MLRRVEVARRHFSKLRSSWFAYQAFHSAEGDSEKCKSQFCNLVISDRILEEYFPRTLKYYCNRQNVLRHISCTAAYLSFSLYQDFSALFTTFYYFSVLFNFSLGGDPWPSAASSSSARRCTSLLVRRLQKDWYTNVHCRTLRWGSNANANGWRQPREGCKDLYTLQTSGISVHCHCQNMLKRSNIVHSA